MASHVLKNTQASLEVTFSVGNADADVTVTVTSGDGTTLTSGTAVQSGAAGHYTFTLAPQSALNSLTVTWTGTFSGVAQSVETYAEIVGGYIFTVADARAFGDKALNDATKYPDADIRAARERITDLFQQVCNVSFVPRYARELRDGNGRVDLWLYNRRPSRLVSITMDGTALTAGELADIALWPTGRITRKTTGWWSLPWPAQNITVVYEHGFPQAPLDIQRAALVLARYELVANDISDRMVAFDNDLGSVRLSVPGRQYPTGIPIVDATLARYDETPHLLA